MATKRLALMDSVVGIAAIVFITLCSASTVSGQSLPPGIKLRPLNFQNAGVAPLTNGVPTNAVANTNLVQLAQWLRQHLGQTATTTNTGSSAQAGQPNATASKTVSAGVDDEAYWLRPNGTPSVINIAPGKQRRAVAVTTDEATRDGNVRGFFRNRRAAMRMEDPDTEFEIRQRETDSTGTFHYRLQQRFQGIKVWGGEAAVHLALDGSVESMEGAFITTPRGIATNPVVQLADAVQAVSQRDYAGRGKVFGAPELVISGALDELPRLAWMFVMQSSAADSKRFLVDAVSGEILRATSLVCEGAVVGSGVDSLGVTRTLNLWQSGPTYYMVDTSKSMYAITSAPPSLSASKGTITIADFAHSQDLNVADYSRSASPTSGWVPDAVSAAFGLSKVYDYYLAKHGRNSYDNKGNTLLGMVRYGSGLQNAFWNHPQDFMIYGDGFAASLDVCGHEVTHGVMFNTGDSGVLDYVNQSGALNEALADIFGEMVEARTYGTNDWLMGSQLGAPIRSMANPALYGQPSNMSQYLNTTADNGGVHLNSGIINHAYYKLAVGLPSPLGNGDAERIFYRAMTLHLLKQSQFIDARHACVTSAEELFGVGSAQALKTAEAFDAVEIVDAPPTAPPGATPPVAAADSTMCLRYDPIQGAHYLVRREASLADPSTGTTLGLAWYLSNKRISTSGDGSAAVFVGADYDFGIVATDGSIVNFDYNPGAYHSAAISPDGSRVAVVLRNQFNGQPDNTINIVNLISGGLQTFTLYGVTSEGGYIDVVEYADVMDFTADGRYLIYDARCLSTTGGGDILDGWTIFRLDTQTGNIQTLLDLSADYSIGNPALGNTHDNLLTFDIWDQAGNSTIVAWNVWNGAYGVVGTTAGLGVPVFTGDDTAIVFSQYDASVTSQYSLYRRTLASDGVTPTGTASLWLRDANYNTIYRRGTYYPSDAAPHANITAPAAGQAFATPTNIVIQASASDTDGTVSKVEFYVNATKIGTDITAPYSVTWANAPVGSHRITARAIDNLGAAGDSGNVLVFVLVPPALTSQPQSKVVKVGTNFSFNVTATGTAPLFYQWRKDGNPLPGATNTSYNIVDSITNDAGIYSVMVSNAARTVTSTNAALVVNVPPSVTTQPLSQAIIVGSNVTLFVTAAGTMPLKYQWRTNGVNLAGATNASYPITGATTNAARTYSVVVTNIAGSITSSNAVLTVLVPPAFTVQPTNRAVKVGTNTTFAATATGTDPLWYQWRKDTVDLPNATNTSYAIATVQTNDAGVYSVLVTNIAGVVLSSNATLTVNVPPGITEPPQSLTVVRGSNALFSVTATGTAPLRYQWRSNAVNVVNATNASFTITNVQTNAAVNYSVRVTNIAGSVTSAVTSLTVLVPPGFTAQPTNRTVVAGTNWTFACAASGTAPLAFQWRKNGTDVAGATNSSLPLANIQTNDSGAYTVLVTNIAGSALSSNATLTVLVRPTIVEPPQSLTVVRGSNATFSVLADGTLPLRYRWRSNAVFIVNATNATYTLANAQTNATGANFTVVITNIAGSITSSAASLTVLLPPTFSVQPLAKTVLAGSNLTFIATATGGSPLSYQWRKDAVDLPGGTNSSYNIPSAQTNDAGNYSVLVTNLVGNVASSNALLVVNAPPTILTDPLSQSVAAGADVLFTVNAGGTAPLKYQWRKGVATIGGATNDFYALSNVQADAATNYSVVVTNNFGSATSAVATLTVTLNVPPPLLNFAATGTNVVLSWTTNAPGFTLQSTTNLNLPNLWASNPPPPVVVGTNYVVTNAVSGEQKYYRLKK